MTLLDLLDDYTLPYRPGTVHFEPSTEPTALAA